MLRPMSPTSSMFLVGETREHPLHVGGLQLFEPPAGASALDVREMFDRATTECDVAPLFRKRAHRSLGSFGQWAWDADDRFDLEHHVRRDALPRPGRVLELLALCSRLHSVLLDRHRPPWEMHLIEGLADGRYAVYFKVHHALMDGVSALHLLARTLSSDPDERGMAVPWARLPGTDEPLRAPEAVTDVLADVPRAAVRSAKEIAAVAPAMARLLSRGLTGTGVPVAAPKSMLNVPITGARRFAAQSWPLTRIRSITKATGTTVNDVVLTMSSGALRKYLSSLGALPDASLVAAVPVSLRGRGNSEGDGGGNSLGVVLCNLGTNLPDPVARLVTVHASMEDGKASLHGLSQTQILALSAVAFSPLALERYFRSYGFFNPPFNLLISNVPGPRRPMYWNGARLDGLYPLSIPYDGQALNITCTSYADDLAFGLIGCRRTVPHLQRLLTYLDEELAALEEAVAA